MNKIKLHIFGDSFSQTFTEHLRGGSQWVGRYIDFIKETPKTYSEIVSEYFDYDLKNYSIPGCSNYTIFETFLDRRNLISPNDVVIINWTAINRFRIANHQNNFIDILPNTPHPKQNDDVSLITTQEIAINRNTYSVYWTEILRFVKLINELSTSKKIYHWSWEKPSVEISSNIWSEENIKYNTVMVANYWKNVDNDVKNAIGRSCDVMIDVTKPYDLEEIKKQVKEKKKIFVINIEMVEPNILNPIYSNFNCVQYNTINHRKECHSYFIPYYPYQTISDETYGEIKDVHYGKNGHIELANTFIDLIK